MMTFSTFLGSIGDPALLAVARHWDEARGGRPVPAWRDLDPTALRDKLPIVWSWRWDRERSTFVGRLAGEEIRAAHGRSIRGLALEEFFPPESAAFVKERYLKLLDPPAAMRSVGQVYGTLGGAGTGERIVLPLAADDGIFGATVYRFDRGGAPPDGIVLDRFGIKAELFPLAPP